MKIQKVYSKLICGGIGYSPVLYRIKQKNKYTYYRVLGHCEAEAFRELSNLSLPHSPKRNSWNMWLKHRNDNEITAKEFLKIIKNQRGQNENSKSQPISKSTQTY